MQRMLWSGQRKVLSMLRMLIRIVNGTKYLIIVRKWDIEDNLI